MNTYANDYDDYIVPYKASWSGTQATRKDWFANLLNDGGYLPVQDDQWSDRAGAIPAFSDASTFGETIGSAVEGVWGCPEVGNKRFAGTNNGGEIWEMGGYGANLHFPRGPMINAFGIGDRLRRFESYDRISSVAVFLDTWTQRQFTGAGAIGNPTDWLTSRTISLPGFRTGVSAPFTFTPNTNWQMGFAQAAPRHPNGTANAVYLDGHCSGEPFDVYLNNEDDLFNILENKFN